MKIRGLCYDFEIEDNGKTFAIIPKGEASEFDVLCFCEGEDLELLFEAVRKSIEMKENKK